MPEKITISHRGARYEIGRGKRYYGIWVAGAPESDPIDRWPETRDGWVQAWTRFTAIETPESIVAVERPRSRFKFPGVNLKKSRAVSATITDAAAGRRSEAVRALAGAGLLGFGVLMGLIGLFPGYAGSPSLASQADQLVPHLIYLAVWAASAVLIAAGLRPRTGAAPPGTARSGLTRTGALLGIGLSAVTFGLYFADLGQVISGGASLLGAGLVLSLLGWAACAAGSAIALTAHPGTPPSARSHGLHIAGGLVRPSARDAGPITLLLLAAVGAVVTFAPSWDSYTLAQASTGATQTVTAGNAFANPGPVIAGNVAVMIAIVAVAVVAALWRPAWQGAVLLAGAIVPLAAQAISALIQVSGTTSPSLFGISQAQASAAGLTISAGVTPIFWVYCVFVISLVISCAWMLTTPHYPAMPPAAPAPDRGSVPPSQSPPGEDADSGDDAEDDEESTYA